MRYHVLGNATNESCSKQYLILSSPASEQAVPYSQQAYSQQASKQYHILSKHILSKRASGTIFSATLQMLLALGGNDILNKIGTLVKYTW
jgi:hypothetical protein